MSYPEWSALGLFRWTSFNVQCKAKSATIIIHKYAALKLVPLSVYLDTYSKFYFKMTKTDSVWCLKIKHVLA